MLQAYPGVRRWEQTDDIAPERRPAALPGPEDDPTRVGAGLRWPGRLADPPRADRPGAALRGARRLRAAPRPPGRTGRRGGRRPARRIPRPIPTTRSGWRPGPSSTKRSNPCPTPSGRSSTSSGIRDCLSARPPRCWGSPNGWPSASRLRPRRLKLHEMLGSNARLMAGESGIVSLAAQPRG